MTPADTEPALTLVIPALNEEDAISETLQRAVSAARILEAETDICRCQVVLVDDGSTDRTLERAKTVPGVRIVTYKPNRGYGAAIETGYAAGDGSHVAFMDADGTCDPLFLRNLWNEMKAADAHVVLGCRLHQGSKMPRVRRLGNTPYAWLLSAISGEKIRDTASGMRLLRRDLLPMVAPLPSGLSYTPAMSARAILDPRIIIREINMPYEERQGESKLHVVEDGIRFLRIIVTTGVFYTPLRIFGGTGLLFLAAAGLLGLATRPHVSVSAWTGPLLLALLGMTSAALGLVFHFFSKQVIPEWPTSALERGLARLCRVRFLVPGALLIGALAAILLATDTPPHWLPPLGLHAAVLMLLVAAGVFIVNETYQWVSPGKTSADLLKGARVLDTDETP